MLYLFPRSRVPGLNSVKNSNWHINILSRLELFFPGSFFTKYVHLHFILNLHNVSICNVRIRDRVFGLGSGKTKFNSSFSLNTSSDPISELLEIMEQSLINKDKLHHIQKICEKKLKKSAKQRFVRVT